MKNNYLKPWVEAHIGEYPAARYAKKMIRYQAMADAAIKDGLPSTVTMASMGGAVIAVERKLRLKARGQKAARTRMAHRPRHAAPPVAGGSSLLEAIDTLLNAAALVEREARAISERNAKAKEIL